MSDRIVLMRQGRIAQLGTPRALYDRPASRYVADFVGDTNLLAGTVVESAGEMAAIKVGDATLRGTTEAPLAAGTAAWLTVRPEAIRLADGGSIRPGENVLAGVVADTVYAGAALRLHVTLADGRRVVANLPSGTVVANGSAVTLAWPAAAGRCVGD